MDWDYDIEVRECSMVYIDHKYASFPNVVFRITTYLFSLHLSSFIFRQVKLNLTVLEGSQA